MSDEYKNPHQMGLVRSSMVSPSLGAILGPCPCQGCGAMVFWGRSYTRSNGIQTRGFWAWRERTGRVHECVRKPLSKRAAYYREYRARKRRDAAA